MQSSTLEEQRIKAEIFRMSKKVIGNKVGPKILIVREFIDNIEKLYTAADAFVLPVRGGGWEMCYLEALSCGLPVIGTLCGGQEEYMNADNAVIVKANEVDYCRNMEDFTFYDDTMLWHNPDEDDLRKKMRQVFENESLRKSLSSVARGSVLHYTWDNAVEKIIDRLNELS